MAITPGSPKHPEHDRYLMALGQAVMAAADLSARAFDLVRVLGDVPSDELYNDPLGRLEDRLQKIAKRRTDVPGLPEFIDELADARTSRNDLIHAMPDSLGLQRLRSREPLFWRNFHTIEDLQRVTDQMRAVTVRASGLLWHDDGDEISRWRRAGGE